ncbi:restriction endonuclease subunit S, partial [Ralstonia mannitolilytica]|uniref:restriction endonuclease subunit S n=1 Tax=Ralstonia mannitolilytica TaxID=105219 RepID=UPI00292F74D1
MSRKFQCRAIPSAWLENNGRRLDCGPYMSGAVEAKELLKRHKNEALKSLTANHNGGIFNGPRFPRVYVDDPTNGVPFLGSTDILDADLSNVSLLSKKQINGNPALVLDEGWTLITCSGTIGRMAYARSDMKGMAGSQHFMRVVPDITKITPGYLYAYLSSRFGVPIVVSGTYGAIIQHIEPHHIADLPVPRLGDIEEQANELVQRAAELRVEATELLKTAGSMVNYQAESIIKCNTPDLPCTRPCRRPMGTRYQHLSAEERA